MKRLPIILLALFLLTGVAFAEEAKKEKWVGIDEAVVTKYATDKGQQASEPLFNVEGDMLLFLFTVAGASGGFIMGYYWHKVFVVDKPSEESND